MATPLLKHFADNIISTIESNASFIYAGLTTRYRKKTLYKNSFVFSNSRDI